MVAKAAIFLYFRSNFNAFCGLKFNVLVLK